MAAAIFSTTIREYSAGEHFPRVINCPRRPILSHEANANSNIITGNETDFLRRCFLIAGRWDPTVGAARSVASARDKGDRPTPGPHICFICLPTFIIARTRPAWVTDSDHKMTPQQYRQRWELPSTYPLVAPDYAKTRSSLAMKIGLGRKGQAAPKTSRKRGRG